MLNLNVAMDAGFRGSEMQSLRFDRLESLDIGAIDECHRIYAADKAKSEIDPRFNANTWLREVHELVRPFFTGAIVLGLGRGFDEVCEGLAGRFAGAIKMTELSKEFDRLCSHAKRFLDYLSLPYPKGKTEQTAIARLQDVKWWRKKLNVAIPRILDQVSRKLGHVHRDGDLYISNIALDCYRKKLRSNRQYLEEMEATNNLGQTYKLSELAEKSISNAVNRVTELMVRCRGMEERAEEIGYGFGLFVTMTAPSKYHRVSRGKLIDRWNFTSPKDVNEYFNSVWRCVRSDLQRKGVDYFGLRVAEPHHDGTPHWHMLVYTNGQENHAEIRASLEKYNLREDGNERGAKKARIQIVPIDERGGTGYIAKYISKNINGKALDIDDYGKNAATSAERVVAWASTWGIRQFQFFGTAPVSVWRELRRVSRQVPGPYEAARCAADSGDFKAFWHEHDKHAFKLYREPDVDTETGETTNPYNEYGELKLMPIKGIVSCWSNSGDGIPLITRLLNWSVQAINKASEALQAWTCVNNCTDIISQEHFLLSTDAQNSYR